MSASPTYIYSGAPYYNVAGAEGFFFAGSGADFKEKSYSSSMAFVAKTSESGIGTSNCITTTYTDSGFTSFTYSTLVFIGTLTTATTNDNWSTLNTSYSPTFTNLDFTNIIPVCEHTVTFPTYTDQEEDEGISGSYSLASFTKTLTSCSDTLSYNLCYCDATETCLTSPGFTFTDSSRTVDFPSTLDVGDYMICINGEIGGTPSTFTSSFTHTVVYVPANEAPEYTSSLESYESFVGESLIVYLPSFTDADENDSHTETGYQVKNGV